MSMLLWATGAHSWHLTDEAFVMWWLAVGGPSLREPPTPLVPTHVACPMMLVWEPVKVPIRAPGVLLGHP